ncbi:MAG TPA: hypothetical protein VLK33_00125, partial [Terriglobales bacterium]|nr:hypothetical protein [Terriglobales bacterium]
MADCEVAVIGAGPYGLSVAAYLNSLQVNYRAFGSPMQTWRENMPKGMRLKSEGFASSLCEPSKKFTLGAYCAEKNIPYADLGIPVKV